MGYKIIENPVRFHEEVYEDFKEDYMNNTQLTVKELMEKYDFNQVDYKLYRKKVTERTGFIRQGKVKQPKYMFRRPNGKYTIVKRQGKELHRFGTFEKKIATKIRDKLIECEWDKSQLKKIQSEVMDMV